jgi:hypothetical protein
LKDDLLHYGTPTALPPKIRASHEVWGVEGCVIPLLT